MDDAAPIDEALLPALLESFYGRVRQDPLIGPVFNAAIHDWDEHLGRIGAFWSSVMLTSGRYKGNPVAKHLIHAPHMTRENFERWLAIWQATTDEMLPPDQAVAMQAKARRIAESLQLAVSFRTPEQMAQPEGPASQPYRTTPVFDDQTLPQALRKAHSTRKGVWGVVRVLEGKLRFAFEDGSPARLLGPGATQLIEPEQPHYVEPVGPMRMQVEFYDHPPALAA